MKNVLLDNLMKEISSISSEHDHCLDEVISLYGNKEYQYTNLEQSISKSITIDKPIPQNIKLTKEEASSDFFREEYDNEVESIGSINSLIIAPAKDIEI